MHQASSVALAVFVAFGAPGVSAQQPADVGAARTIASNPGTSMPARVLPGTRPSVFTTIQGNALTSTNGVLVGSPVRLRDARFGRIVDTTTTDKDGLFTFRGVDPGNYVIELMGNDQTILAASPILNVDAGSAVSTVVKLPFRLPPVGGLFGHTAASAIAVSAAAAASGVLARNVTTCASAPCGS